MFFDPQTGGFHDPAIRPPPPGAVAISPERHVELLAGQLAGRRIVAGDGGLPVLADPAAPDLEAARRRAQLRLAELAERMCRPFIEGVAWPEMLAWTIKEAAAKTFVDDPTDPEASAFLAIEADETGETVAELAALILGEAAQMRDAVMRITGLRRSAAMAVRAATTVAEIRAAVASAEAEADAFLATFQHGT